MIEFQTAYQASARVVTAADGLATSALDESHRFDNPALAITVARL